MSRLAQTRSRQPRSPRTRSPRTPSPWPPSLRTLLLSLSLLAFACAPPPQSEGDTQGGGASGDTQVGFGDAGPDTGGGGKTDAGGGVDSASGGGSDAASDAAVADAAGELPDGSGSADATGSTDAGGAGDGAAGDAAGIDGAGSDAGPIAPPCGQVTFSHTPAAGTKQVLVSGSFNGWSDKPDTAAVMLDDDGDGVWTATLVLKPGSYQYKFVVDGKWIADPVNPVQVDDGFGGKNSLLVVDPCPKALALESHSIDSDKGSLDATFTTPAGALDPSKVSVSLDHQPVAKGAVSWQGGKLKLALTGIAKGIHDVRVTVAGDDTWLLKVYVGVSTDWRDTTIYFVMTDRFVNGDAKNDDPVAGVDKRTNWQGGDFKGVTQQIKAGYFSDLGVGAIWLSWPVKQPTGAEDGSFPDGTGCGLGPGKVKYSPMKYTGFHGYWPVDTGKTEPRFGTMAELQELVDEAHKKGIRVLLDYTANHVHTASSWFTQNKDKGWFHMPAEVCQDVGWDNKPVSCWFTAYLADLDYDNPATIEASLDSAFWWAKQSGADGFRLDAVKHIEMGFVKALRKRATEEMELTGVDFYIVGETFTGDAGAIQAFIGSDKIHAQFDFPANMQLLKGFAKQETGLDAMDATIRGIRGVYANDGQMMSTFIGNHDMARFISQSDGSLPCGIWDIVSNQAAGWKNPPPVPSSQVPYDKLKLAFAYLFTTPGIPLVYYGDEFGLPGAGDPDNRRMMRFGADLSAKETATFEFMKQLGALRAAHQSLRKGSWSAPLWKEADFLSWGRTSGKDQAVVLINRGGGEKKGVLTVTPAGVADGTELTEWFTGAKAKVAGGKLDFAVPARTAQVWVTK